MKVLPLQSDAAGRTGSHRKRGRRAAAFLILVMLILLVVVASTRALVRGESTIRRGDAQRRQSQTMAAAVDAYVASGRQNSDLAMSFPLTESQHIQVQANDGQITARWMKGERLIREMHRSIPTTPETIE